MTEVNKRDNGELLGEYIDEMTPEKQIERLEARVEELTAALDAKVESKVDLTKIKNALNGGTDYVLNAIRPVIDKYEQPTKEAVAKAGGKVSDNPFLSVAVAFGAGIIIGTVLNHCCKSSDD
ncbi:MAG: hypothetical protein Q4F74_01935 [Synergistaceae bacterium]|nr:hypothetical protein [Synergistaceae bacterium]